MTAKLIDYIKTPTKTINGGPVFKITPTVGPIVDPDTGDTIKFIRGFLCTADCYVTFVDQNGVTRTDAPLIKGFNPVPAQQVHECSVEVWGVI